MSKKKKEPKVEKVFEDSSENKENVDAEKVTDENASQESTGSNIDDFLGKDTPENHLTEKQKKKIENLDNVKNKISKILQSSNIEIVDENADDEYENDVADTDGQSQQDYDSLKAMFGDKDKSKKQELTLTIDDFDYSYIGQYLEEYDLMHMKNIKKVRIQKKHSPKLKKLLIAAGVIIVLGIGGFLGYYLTRSTPVYLMSVSLNQSERTYCEGEMFDYTGLYLIAEYSDGSKKNIKLTNSYFNSDQSTGRFEQVGDENENIQFKSGASGSSQTKLVFTYNGFNAEYSVVVEKKIESGLHAFYANGIFNISAGNYITKDFLKIFVDYGSNGVEAVEFSGDYLIYVDGVQCAYSAENNGYKVTGGTSSGSVIKIKDKANYEITLVYGNNYI